MSAKAKEDSSSFEKFRKNFWKEFQGWLFNDQPSITYDVEIDESELRQIRDKYLNREDYPSLNELKKIIIFKNAEDRLRWGTDVTTYADEFDFDLQRGFKKALELARFDLGQVKPKIYEEAQQAEDSSEQITAVKRKTRAVPESVSTRRALVKAFDSSHPKIKKLDQSTCDYLDKKGILVLPEWQSGFEIKTWAEAYDQPELKNRIEKMFSDDRKKG